MARKVGKWNPSLHPRNARGRFTRSATRVMKGSDTSRARSAVTGFTPAKIDGGAGAGQWLARNTPTAPAGADTAMGRYLSGGWRETNTTIRREKTPPADVAEIDAAFTPSGEDLVLRRTVPLAMFAHIPVKDLEGMKVRDAAYASTQLDHPELGPSPADAVTMHIAAAAGTPIYVNADAGEILLGRDTEVAISRAEPNGSGGWDLYGVVIPKTAVKRDRSGDTGDTPTAPEDNRAGQDMGDTGDTTGDNKTPAPPADVSGRPDGNAPDDGQRAAGDATGGGTAPAAGGPLDDMEPLDQARIRIAVEDNAGRIWRNPMVGGSRDDVARYVSEGNLGDLVERHGLGTVWRAVAQDIDARPELLDRSDADIDQAARQRAEAADLLAAQAAGQTRDGDFAAALDTISRGEMINPDRTDTRGRGWDSLREIVGRRQASAGTGRPDTGRDRNDVTGDVTPTAGTGAPETAQPGGTDAPGGQDTPAGPPEQMDIAGGATAFGGTRTDVGLPERPQVGRERAIAQVQQLGLFASDEREMTGQTALLDALLDMPAGPSSAPPPDVSPAALPDAPDAGDGATLPAESVSLVPEDLTGWNDEQLAELFRQVSAVEDMAQLDEAGMRRITEEWDRREQAMADVVASVPEDLTAVADGDLEALFARVTGELGTADNAAVARMSAEFDRRTEADRQAAENAPKLALLARPIDTLTDEEIETAAGYAADLGDEPAIVRVHAEWEARDRAREAAEAAAQAEQQAREAAERAAAVEAAEAAERAAAAAEAAAAEQRGFDAMGAAWAASMVPPMTNAEVGTSARVLGETGMRQTLGDAWVDQQFDNWLERNAGLTVVPEDTRSEVLSAALQAAPDGTKAKVLFAAADKGNTAEFVGWSDKDLHDLIARSMFGSADEQTRAQAQRAGREQNVRAIRALRQSSMRAYRQAQIRAYGAPVADLSDAELQAAPALITVDSPDESVLARLDEVRAEIIRRQADLARVTAEKAAGPSGPARLRNPVNQLGYLDRMAERTSTREEYAAADRLRRAKTIVYGLPETAGDKDIRAAARKDPRPLPERAAQIIAWYRHLGQYEDIPADLPNYRDWIRGPKDEDVPDVPAPLPPANIAKPDEVWKQIQTNAQQEANDGNYETGRRLMRAIARAYGIPSDDVGADRESLREIGTETGQAFRSDDRTPKQRAALFVAEFRRLAEEDGIDPSDTLRYGPPDKGGRKPAAASWRESTPDQQRRIDEMVARGWDWMDAYAEVHGVQVADLRRSQAGTEKDIKQAYAEYVERQFKAAEDATRGNLLRKPAAAKGADSRALFSGPWSTARARASEELLRWWAEPGNQRMTYADFKASLAGGADARAARARMVSAGKGNQFA